jgi:hypothetical protein
VNGANIANRVPHKIFTSLNFNLFVDRSHTRFTFTKQCVRKSSVWYLKWRTTFQATA